MLHPVLTCPSAALEICWEEIYFLRTESKNRQSRCLLSSWKKPQRPMYSCKATFVILISLSALVHGHASIQLEIEMHQHHHPGVVLKMSYILPKPATEQQGTWRHSAGGWMSHQLGRTKNKWESSGCTLKGTSTSSLRLFSGPQSAPALEHNLYSDLQNPERAK